MIISKEDECPACKVAIVRDKYLRVASFHVTPSIEAIQSPRGDLFGFKFSCLRCSYSWFEKDGRDSNTKQDENY